MQANGEVKGGEIQLVFPEMANILSVVSVMTHQCNHDLTRNHHDRPHFVFRYRMEAFISTYKEDPAEIHFLSFRRAIRKCNCMDPTNDEPRTILPSINLAAIGRLIEPLASSRRLAQD